MGTISLQIPQTGQPNATEDVKVATDLTTIQTWANGNVDATNVTAAFAQSAAVNQAGQTVKGAVNISASESTSSASYTTLPTPDQVAAIVLPANGLIHVWFQAMWQESVQGAARAAIFVGASQLQVQAPIIAGPGPGAQAAKINNTTGVNVPLFSSPIGLVTLPATTGYTADVTTGQAVGGFGAATTVDIGTSSFTVGTISHGVCSIFANAGTYTVSVQFKTSSGTVTASNRKLWVRAESFG